MHTESDTNPLPVPRTSATSGIFIAKICGTPGSTQTFSFTIAGHTRGELADRHAPAGTFAIARCPSVIRSP